MDEKAPLAGDRSRGAAILQPSVGPSSQPIDDAPAEPRADNNPGKLTAEERRVLWITTMATFVGGVASIIVAALIVGGAIALLRWETRVGTLTLSSLTFATLMIIAFLSSRPDVRVLIRYAIKDMVLPRLLPVPEAIRQDVAGSEQPARQDTAEGEQPAGRGGFRRRFADWVAVALLVLVLLGICDLLLAWIGVAVGIKPP
jgi:hypothetical protein